MASLPTVQVTGTVYEDDHTTLYNGPIRFVQPVLLRHNDGTTVLPADDGGISYQVVDGVVNVELLYVDAPGWGPTGWAWDVQIPRGSLTKHYALAPSVNDPDTVTLGDLLTTPYVADPGVQFAPANHTHADIIAMFGRYDISNRITNVGETAINRLRPTGQVALADRQMLLTFFMGLQTQTILSFGTTMPNAGLAVGSTHSWVGVYKLVGANLVPDAVSVDDPSKWTAQGSYDTPIFDPAHAGEGAFQGWDEVAGQIYAAAFLWRGGGAPPQLPGGVIWPAEAGFAPRLNGFINNQDFPPTAPFPISSVLDDTRLIQAHFKR